jgi:hypothetical protein
MRCDNASGAPNRQISKIAPRIEIGSIMPAGHSLVHKCHIRSNRVDKKASEPEKRAFGQFAVLRSNF